MAVTTSTQPLPSCRVRADDQATCGVATGCHQPPSADRPSRSVKTARRLSAVVNTETFGAA